MVLRAGFIGTRFSGTDGVSLETWKWAEVLGRLGYEISYFSGHCNKDSAVSWVVPQAYFAHPEVQRLQEMCFGSPKAPDFLRREIRQLTDELKKHLYRYIHAYKPDLLIVENALAIPMHIPLGLAVKEVLQETGIASLAHHHDFFWERERFAVTSIPEVLEQAFPPILPNLAHIVINREARDELHRRKKISSTVIPNVYDFSHPPGKIDAYSRSLPQDFSMQEGELLFVQPTRIVARKGIELAVDLVSRLNEYDIRLVVPHHERDEGDTYAQQVISLAEQSGVSLECSPDIVGLDRSRTSDGRRRYSLWDLYQHADFITYPSLYEGFGNAFLEAVYFRKPIFVNRYKIYRSNIEPFGFQTVSIDGEVTDDAADQVRRLLKDQQLRHHCAEINYELGRKYFSYETLEDHLKRLCASRTLNSK